MLRERKEATERLHGGGFVVISMTTAHDEQPTGKYTQSRSVGNRLAIPQDQRLSSLVPLEKIPDVPAECFATQSEDGEVNSV